MHLTAAGKTDVGKSRNHNEDFLLFEPELGLYVVCDGMGGHAAGEVASKTAAETIRGYLIQHKDKIDGFDGSDGQINDIAQIFRRAVESASQAVFDLASQGHGRHGMGTTCTAMLAVGGKGIMAHVGDSRLYMLRDKVLYQLSEDHTYLAEAVKHGMMTAEQAAQSPYSHMITRGVGVQSSVYVDLFVFDVVANDTYLLCSDGLHQYYEDRMELASSLASQDVNELTDRLIDTANARGGGDNITALVLRANEGEAKDRARADAITSDLQTLRYIGLFIDLDMRELMVVLNAFKPAHFDAGQAVIHEGGTDESLFVIVQGDLEVQRSGKRVARLHAGSHFGEMALLSRRPRSASVVAATDVRLLRMERSAFNQLIKTEPEVGVKFLWKLSQILSLRLDEVYVVAGTQDNERKTIEIDALSPFRRKL